MAQSVDAAFRRFREDVVDLDPKQVQLARRSRDFLIDEIQKLPEKYDDFPWLCGERVLFGSFARKTKICPLDDIDIMFYMHGGGGYERQDLLDQYLFRVDRGGMESPVRHLADSDGNINSTRVLHKFRDYLSDVPQYAAADIHKRLEAVTLRLKSYPWNFDIVPCFGVSSDGGYSTSHYLIPDGKGNWKRTDPRRDAERIRLANQKYDGRILPLIRLLKYWNRRNQAPEMSSYWLETLVLNVFEGIESFDGLQWGLFHFFSSCPDKVVAVCPDPKGLGPNLDAGVSLDTKQKIAAAMSESYKLTASALILELDEKHEEAIAEWGKIFGAEFPSYD